MLQNNKYKHIYRNTHDDFNRDFFIPSFNEAIECYRGSGFFTLDSLILCCDGVLKFLQNKGKMKILCSPNLLDEDIEKMQNGEELDPLRIIKILNDALYESSNLSLTDNDKLDLFCNLMASNIIELKICYKKTGLYHEKFGIFKDLANNYVYFNGSNNFTFKGSVINTESFFCTWSWSGEQSDINSEIDYFFKLWNNELDSHITLTFPESVKNNLFSKYKKSENVYDAVSKLVSSSSSKINEERPYQNVAVNEFVKNSYCHFFEMATGTGKTITSIKCIKKITEDLGKCFAVIVVPQIDLQNQWKKTLEKNGFNKVYLAGGICETKGANEIFEANILYALENKTVVCVCVYKTFFEEVYKQIESIENLFIIVDEAHNLTPNYLDKLPKSMCYRLGLSATIERWSTSETCNIVNFFTNGKETYKYGLKEAIENNYLAPYYYFPLFVNLSFKDFSKYIEKTHKIIKAMNSKVVDEESLNNLRIERSLIIKKSAVKISFLEEMVNSNDYSFKNSVVYCGAGKDSDISIIDKVTLALANDDKYTVSQFTSSTDDRVSVLYEFEQGYFDTLVAIKCFDEGVDVPKLDKIYIMASDSSIRQTVQRRGRVLRRCEETGKSFAYIYDMVIIPPLGFYDGPGILSLLRNEMIRVNEYASLAYNKDEVYEYLERLLDEYDVKLEDLLKDEKEFC